MVQKCCSEDEVMNGLRICVKPGTGSVPMPKLKQQGKNHGLRHFIKHRLKQFVNKHHNFTNEEKGLFIYLYSIPCC